MVEGTPAPADFTALALTRGLVAHLGFLETAGIAVFTAA